MVGERRLVAPAPIVEDRLGRGPGIAGRDENEVLSTHQPYDEEFFVDISALPTVRELFIRNKHNELQGHETRARKRFRTQMRFHAARYVNIRAGETVGIPVEVHLEGRRRVKSEWLSTVWKDRRNVHFSVFSPLVGDITKSHLDGRLDRRAFHDLAHPVDHRYVCVQDTYLQYLFPELRIELQRFRQFGSLTLLALLTPDILDYLWMFMEAENVVYPLDRWGPEDPRVPVYTPLYTATAYNSFVEHGLWTTTDDMIRDYYGMRRYRDGTRAPARSHYMPRPTIMAPEEEDTHMCVDIDDGCGCGCGCV